MSKQQKRVFWPTLVLAVLAVTSICFAAARNRSASAAQRSVPEFKQRIRIWVHGDDVRPKVIHAAPGKALVTVENETSADVSMQLERVLPNRTQPIGGVNLPGRSKRSQGEVTLVPGEYVFYEASRPTIRGRLIVEPR